MRSQPPHHTANRSNTRIRHLSLHCLRPRRFTTSPRSFGLVAIPICSLLITRPWPCWTSTYNDLELQSRISSNIAQRRETNPTPDPSPRRSLPPGLVCHQCLGGILFLAATPTEKEQARSFSHHYQTAMPRRSSTPLGQQPPLEPTMSQLSQYSFDSSDGSYGSRAMIPMSEFLSQRDEESFSWDDENRETSEEWARPVVDAGLDPRKHKVFHHSDKDFLKSPAPFTQVGTELGESGSTVVYKVTCPEACSYRRPLALKVIVCKERTRPPGPATDARKLALQEVRHMSAVRHPHIVAYVGSFEDYCIQKVRSGTERQHRERSSRHSGSSADRPRVVVRLQTSQQHQQVIKRHVLGIAMYPPAQWNLSTLMQEVFRNHEAAEAWIIPQMHTYFGCLAQAVAYLHKSDVRIRHKDIKPENIVIDDFGVPLLTDFGLSKHFEQGQHSEGPTGKTIKYADPEAMHETMRDERSDVFSLGCVYLEIATVLLGRVPMFAEDKMRDDGGDRTVMSDFVYAESLDRLGPYLDLLRVIADDRELIALVDQAVTAVEREAITATSAASSQQSQQSHQFDGVTQDELRERSAKAVREVLPLIGRMMDDDFHQRPFARDLYPGFRHLCDVYEVSGPCMNCEQERRTGRAFSEPQVMQMPMSVTSFAVQQQLENVNPTARARSPRVARSSTAAAMGAASGMVNFALRRANSLLSAGQISCSPTDIEMGGL